MKATTPQLPRVLIEPEQVKLASLQYALKCLASSLYTAADAAGYIWPHTAHCNRCSHTDFCRQVKRIVEKELN